MFVYGRFDASADTVTVTATGRLDDGAGPDVACFVDLASTSGPLTAVLRLGTSFLSVDQARRNLELEQGTPGAERDVEDLCEAAAAAWDERLAALEVDGELVDDEARTTVASHLYRLNLYPNSGHENVGTADEPRWVHASPLLPAEEHTDTRTGSVVVDGKFFVNNGFWDTYRTAWPLYSLLYPRAGCRAGRGVPAALPRGRLDPAVVVAGVRRLHGRDVERHRVRRCPGQGRRRGRRDRVPGRRPQRHGRDRRHPGRDASRSTGRSSSAGRRSRSPRGCRGRSTATSTTSGSRRWRAGCSTMIVFPTATTARG